MRSYSRGVGFKTKENCEGLPFGDSLTCQNCSGLWYLECEEGFSQSHDCKTCIKNNSTSPTPRRSLWHIIFAFAVILFILGVVWKVIVYNETPTVDLLATTALGDPNSSDSYAIFNSLGGKAKKYYV